ncbi:TetR/AcrR family transcriptional regulator [Streptomyces sp. NPDC005531]|uniref:TetR/AcrR family transcriptional regulator n=1 Tax=Streptomyces sp. NPDC005531 TaxID=3364722 RepID=UPI0036C7202C
MGARAKSPWRPPAPAVEAFASGRAISLDAIAKRAGVGNATLYRHFPTREDLVEEVYRDQIRPLRENARTRLATESPAQALHAWMLRLADWAGERRGICEALIAMSASGRFGTGPVCDEVQQVLAMALENGATAGELRGDIDPADVGGILAGLLSQLNRMLDVVVDGLRPRYAIRQRFGEASAYAGRHGCGRRGRGAPDLGQDRRDGCLSSARSPPRDSARNGSSGVAAVAARLAVLLGGAKRPAASRGNQR